MDKGSLLFIDFDDLMMKFAKNNDLANYCILIASHDIVGSMRQKAEESEYGVFEYSSKYENIEFVNTLKPKADIMHWCEAGNTMFPERYEQQLLEAEPFSDICAIVDMIVNDGCDVIIVMAAYEVDGNVLGLLQLFIEENFFLRGYTFESLERLAKVYDDKPMYKKVVESLDFEVPPEFDGKNFEVILHNIGDRQKIKEQLEFQKGIATELKASAADDKDALTNLFFNRFTESLEDKVKEALMKRDIEVIKEMCRAKKVRIGMITDKEKLVDKLIKEMRLSSDRIVRYE